jgi:hypothetical protein
VLCLDAPLPAALTGRDHTWLTRYRCYPVFSPGWMRGRLLAWSFWLGLLLLPLLISTWIAPPGYRPWGGMLTALLELTVPLVLGPWLGVLVRRRQLAPEREWAALWGAVGVAVLAVVLMHVVLADPLKQWVAERTGQLDAEGRRSHSTLVIGIQVLPPQGPPAAARPPADAQPEGSADPVGDPPVAAPADAPTSGTPATQADAGAQALSRWAEASNVAVRALMAFWFAGGFALWAWRRERAGLLALQREHELVHAQAQRREAELRLSVLAAQVEPHFLFNTLAGVRSAIVTDPARASEMVDRLVDYLRASIPRLRHDGSAQQATVRAQLDSVRAYLALMAARMPRLRYTVAAPPDLLDAPCPPLMLISLAENAVKHGVEPKIGPAHIAVEARRTPAGGLALSVADDGAGFGHETTSGSGLGLVNIRERLAQLYGPRATLGLQARPGGGVVATLTLPLPQAPPGAPPAADPPSPA